jgi:hypothetical protein
MSFKVTEDMVSTKTAYELPLADTQPAIIIGVIDLGIQDGKFGKKHKVAIIFELPLDLVSSGDHAGKPKTITKEMAISFGEMGGRKSDLRALIEAADKSRTFKAKSDFIGYDFGTLAGKAVMVSIIHKQTGEKANANVAGVLPLSRGMTVPAQVHESIVFDKETDSLSKIESLPKFLRDKIANVNSTVKVDA